jgi:hypothetical protein
MYMLYASMESDHILITAVVDDNPTVFAKITDADSYNTFVDDMSGLRGSIMCSSSMDNPFEYTTSMDLVLLANNITGNTIMTPDNYYQPIPDIRDANGIGEHCYWIMQKNAIETFPDILPENWLCYNEDELEAIGFDVRLMDAIPQTMEHV